MEVCAATLLFLVTTLLSPALGAPILSVDATPSSYGTAETLTCTDANYTSGNGYIWMKGSDTIFTNAGEESTTGKYSEIIDGNSFKLVINDIDVSDEGTYKCSHNFDDSNTLNLEVESRGNILAELLSSKKVEVTFKQIYPSTLSAVITCDLSTVAGSFVNLVTDGDRFTRTWQSTSNYSTLPTSCSALVTLRTTFNTAFTVTSATTVAQTTASTTDDDNGLSTGAIVGIAIAVAVVVVGATVVILAIMKKLPCNKPGRYHPTNNSHGDKPSNKK